MHEFDKEGIQFEIQVDPRELAKFCNQAQIAHEPEHFELRFFYISPAERKGTLIAHVIFTPWDMNRIYKALAENIHKYE